MMILRAKIAIRNAKVADRAALEPLIQYEPYVHSHLDWRNALDWLTEPPFLIAERDGQIVSALACAPEAPGVAWIRVFATVGHLSPAFTWRALWPEAERHLLDLAVTQIAVIPIYSWFRRILKDSAFRYSHDVVLLAWTRRELPEIDPIQARIRPMRPEDLPAVAAVDAAAFPPLWRNSRESLEMAWRQSVLASVAEDKQGILGYQISTPSPRGGHLARLAIHPRSQRRGIGQALIRELLEQFVRRGAAQVTVNTQNDNRSSLALYEKLGFRRTGEEYPVYLNTLAGTEAGAGHVTKSD